MKARSLHQNLLLLSNFFVERVLLMNPELTDFSSSSCPAFLGSHLCLWVLGLQTCTTTTSLTQSSFCFPSIFRIKFKLNNKDNYALHGLHASWCYFSHTQMGWVQLLKASLSSTTSCTGHFRSPLPSFSNNCFWFFSIHSTFYMKIRVNNPVIFRYIFLHTPLPLDYFILALHSFHSKSPEQGLAPKNHSGISE